MQNVYNHSGHGFWYMHATGKQVKELPVDEHSDAFAPRDIHDVALDGNFVSTSDRRDCPRSQEQPGNEGIASRTPSVVHRKRPIVIASGGPSYAQNGARILICINNGHCFRWFMAA